MSDARPSDAREVFCKAIELDSAAERIAYLDDACAGNQELRSEVEELLKAHVEAGDFLEPPVAEPQATIDAPAGSERPGQMVGRYKLRELLGEGGFGVVWAAEQTEPVRRRVALKVIKPGMDSAAVVARFEAERQALALMDHPNIARVLDAGTTEQGRPYFVMELIRGVPITEYCDRNKLTVRERLDLFIPVCKAVQHAHQKGVIHRDLKPSNVLVTLHDGVPVPKVIDFGVAKALSQRLTDKTVYTRVHQAIGTLAYMSPEQAELSGLDIDTRSDVYALGVLLYELLIGSTPFDKKRLEQAAFHEACRIIREEDPPRPSKRISTLGEQATVISDLRKTDPQTLGQFLGGDLDWILMKTLEKDRTRRYATANGLAEDVERLLADKPIEARPPSAAYRVRKFVRRNRLAVIAGAAVSVALVLGLIGSTSGFFWAISEAHERGQQAMKAELARAEAERQRALAKQEAERYARLLYISDMYSAERAWESNNVAMVETLLQRYRSGTGREKQRGWEWYHLWRLWTRNSHLLRDSLPVNAVRSTVSSDGQRLALAHLEGEYVTVWDLRTKKQMAAFGQPDSTWRWDNFVALSSDGKSLVHPTGEFSELMLCNLSTGEEQPLKAGNGAKFTMAAFHPATPNILAAASDDLKIRLWDVTTHQVLLEFGGHASSVQAITFAPQGNLIASGSHDGAVLVWDTVSGAVKWSLAGHTNRIYGIAVTPDGKRVATASADRTVKVWDLLSGRLLHTLGSFSDEVRSIAFSPDGKLLAAGIRGGSVYVWDSETFFEQDRIRGQRGVWNLSFLHDGRLSFQKTGDCVQVICDIRQRSTRRISVGEGRLRSPVFVPSENGMVLAATTAESSTVVRRWRVAGEDLEEMAPLMPGIPVGCLATSPRGLLALGDFDGTDLLLYSGPDEVEPVARLAIAEVRGLRCAAFCGESILSVGYADGKVAVWRRDGDLSVWKTSGPWAAHAAAVTDIAFHPKNAGLMATGSDDKTVQLWDWQNARHSQSPLLCKTSVFSLAFSSTGEQIAVSHFDSEIDLWDLNSGAKRLLMGHTVLVTGVAFLHDCRTLISAGGDRVGKVWDLPTGQERFNLQGESSIFVRGTLAVSPDERLIAAGARDGTLHLFWAASDEEVKAAGW